MKIFIGLSESPLEVRKIAVYRFLISVLVPKLLRFKDLKNGRKYGTKNAQSWIKSIKIDKSVTSCDGHLIVNDPFTMSRQMLV